jgi:hypothetical protein
MSWPCTSNSWPCSCTCAATMLAVPLAWSMTAAAAADAISSPSSGSCTTLSSHSSLKVLRVNTNTPHAAQTAAKCVPRRTMTHV